MIKKKLKSLTNSIIEKESKDSINGNSIIDIRSYPDGMNLFNYRKEILKIIKKDERVADAILDEEQNIDIVFYTDYCPNYITEDEEFE